MSTEGTRHLRAGGRARRKIKAKERWEEERWEEESDQV